MSTGGCAYYFDCPLVAVKCTYYVDFVYATDCQLVAVHKFCTVDSTFNVDCKYLDLISELYLYRGLNVAHTNAFLLILQDTVSSAH